MTRVYDENRGLPKQKKKKMGSGADSLSVDEKYFDPQEINIPPIPCDLRTSPL
jgi:hypothetical protein